MMLFLPFREAWSCGEGRREKVVESSFIRREHKDSGVSIKSLEVIRHT
jgi:hypothetical protein